MNSSGNAENGNRSIFQEIEAITLTERVIAALKNAFFSGVLKPGDAIVERQIAREMNVGTPVVREALISLKHDGFVRRVKNKGSFITAFDPDEVRALYTLRIELETLALQWARPLVTPSDLDELKRLVDRLVEAAMDSGALGARLTGAGFGGCAVVFCRRADVAKVRDGIAGRFYSGCPDHILQAEAGCGAVHS